MRKLPNVVISIAAFKIASFLMLINSTWKLFITVHVWKFWLLENYEAIQAGSFITRYNTFLWKSNLFGSVYFFRTIQL